MSRASRILLLVALVAVASQNARASGEAPAESWFDSVVQAIVSLFTQPEFGPVADPNG